jgi:hypothetical protein
MQKIRPLIYKNYLILNLWTLICIIYLLSGSCVSFPIRLTCMKKYFRFAAKLFLLGILVNTSSAIAQSVPDNSDVSHVKFDPFYLAETRLVQVHFSENPTKDKAFFLTAPSGWVRIQDITRLFNADLVKRMNPNQVLTRYQSVYPFIVIAKSLDALAWQLDPYNFNVPMQDLQLYVKEFLIDQYVNYKKIDRSTLSDEAIYQLLKEEVGDQEFSLKVTWPWCETQSMKRACSLIKSRRLQFDINDVSLDFDTMPVSLPAFLEEIKPQIKQWYASSRRLYVIRSILTVVETNESKKKSEFKIKKLGEKEDSKKDLAPEFFKILWDKVPVFTYADYCAFPTLVCNRFERDKFAIALTNQNIEVLLSIKLNDED